MIVAIRDAILRVDVADTKQTQAIGLGGQDSLAPNGGMLFAYPSAGRLMVWMKAMRFPIDIIWIGPDLSVVDITPNVAPETYPAKFYSCEPAQYVLEVNAGWTHRHGVRPGDIVRFAHAS